ncbi:MAG TPA: hypothetical protein VGB91_04725 [Rhizomicrobium sp.]
MNFKQLLSAAATVAVLALAGAGAAEAAPFHGGVYHDRGRVERVERRIVDHRIVFNTLRGRHIRYVGTPYFVRGHYVVRSFDRFGRVRFVEVNPYSGAFIGFFRF